MCHEMSLDDIGCYWNDMFWMKYCTAVLSFSWRFEEAAVEKSYRLPMVTRSLLPLAWNLLQLQVSLEQLCASPWGDQLQLLDLSQCSMKLRNNQCWFVCMSCLFVKSCETPRQFAKHISTQKDMDKLIPSTLFITSMRLKSAPIRIIQEMSFALRYMKYHERVFSEVATQKKLWNKNPETKQGKKKYNTIFFNRIWISKRSNRINTFFLGIFVA